MRVIKLLPIIVFVIAIPWLLVACASEPAPIVTLPEETVPPTDTLEPTATPVPPRELNICLGQEPQTLYLYGGSSRAMWSVLEAVYDGPIDIINYVEVPVILEDLPDESNGDAVYRPVSVQRGQKLVDAEGNLAYLDTGTRIRPAGCRDITCEVRWDGKTPVEMDQLILTFRLKSGLLWSNGEPLTAQDSVYSYQVASDPDTPVTRTVLEKTASYIAKDEQTIEWSGLPGYSPSRFTNHFFIPLPEHAWSRLTPLELLSAEEPTRKPIGWGAYVIEEWKPAEYLRMRSNPNYFRAGEGLPKFDLLTFHFLGEQADNNLVALTEGVCDIVDQTTLLEDQFYTVDELEKKGKLKTFAGLGPEWAHLDFGIKQAVYDNGYNPWAGYRQDIFSDLRMRQAFTYCMDRQLVIDQLLYGHSQIPAGFFPPDHPLFDDDLKPIPYDPEEGMRLLEQVGWRDLDGDSATPRTALGVENVLNGTPLQVTYLTTPDRLGRGAAERLTASLSGCGIQVDVQLSGLEQIFASGPQGSVFGRNFDLAQFSWAAGRQTPCFLYTSDQIPSADNGWIGVNVSGFNDNLYDEACQTALQTSSENTEAYLEVQLNVQQLYTELLPSVPLYYEVHLDVARPDLCNFDMDTSSRSEFWNLELIDYGEGCS